MEQAFRCYTPFLVLVLMIMMMMIMRMIVPFFSILCLDYFALKMEAIRCFETSVSVYIWTSYNIPEKFTFKNVVLIVIDFIYVKYVNPNLQVSHRRHVCKSGLFRKILYTNCRDLHRVQVGRVWRKLVTGTISEAKASYGRPKFY